MITKYKDDPIGFFFDIGKIPSALLLILGSGLSIYYHSFSPIIYCGGAVVIIFTIFLILLAIVLPSWAGMGFILAPILMSRGLILTPVVIGAIVSLWQHSSYYLGLGVVGFFILYILIWIYIFFFLKYIDK